jgi:peptidoglycan-associated lipoprotein
MAPAPQAATQPATCSQDSDCASAQLCLRSRCVDIGKGLPECENVWVHFSFDRADLESQELPLLQRVNRCVTADRSFHVVIEGNADERGTTEYNLALGDRRASTVERYLESLGVSSSHLETVSYGKEKPLCTQHNEDCWSKNRRAMVKNLNLADAGGR